MADSELLERTDTGIELILEDEHKESPDEPDKHRHAYSKKALDANLFEGVPIKALCGHIKTGLAHPDKTDIPACEICLVLLETYPPE
jgi:hypothetical protein